MRDLAARLNLSPATVSALETGRTAITIDRLVHVASVLDIPPQDLLPQPHHPQTTTAAMPARHWRHFPPLETDPVKSAAIEIFLHAGYHGANMRSIAERAGMSVAGIYRYYPTKHAILTAILDLTMDELHWRLPAARDEATASGGGPLHRLAAITEALALFHTLRPALAFIGASEMRSLEPAHRERIALRRTQIQHLIDVEIDAAINAGLAHTTHPKETGRAIATMCTSLPQWFNNTGPTTPRQIAAGYATLALRMIGASHAITPPPGAADLRM